MSEVFHCIYGYGGIVIKSLNRVPKTLSEATLIACFHYYLESSYRTTQNTFKPSFFREIILLMRQRATHSAFLLQNWLTFLSQLKATKGELRSKNCEQFVLL